VPRPCGLSITRSGIRWSNGTIAHSPAIAHPTLIKSRTGAEFPLCSETNTCTCLPIAHTLPPSLMSLIAEFIVAMDAQMSHISKLPDEMLEAILCVYSDTRLDAALLLVCTHVCRWWRYVALSSPRLWRYIDVCRPHLALLSLTRSGSSVPLSVVSSSGAILPWNWVLLHPYAARIHEIDLDMLYFDIRRVMFGIGKSCPKLHSLRIISRGKGGDQDDSELQCDMPSLRRLSLDGVSLKWGSLTNLTHLSLWDLCAVHAPSLHQLHSILRHSPRLESLSLAFLEHAPSMQLDTQVVELPLLLDIHLCLCPAFTTSLLASLSIPLSAHLRVGSSLTHSSYDGLLSLFPKIDGTPYPHLCITKHSKLSIQLREILLHQSETYPFANASSKPELIINMPRPIPAYSWILSNVVPRLFDLFHLTTLELDIVWAVDISRVAVALYNLLTATPNLKTLRASQHGAECLSMVLGRPGSDRFEFEVLCPSLSLLSFGAPDQMWWDFPLRWLNPLVACLEARAACTGARLKTIEFLGQGRIEQMSAQVLAPFVEEIVDSISRYDGTNYRPMPRLGTSNSYFPVKHA